MPIFPDLIVFLYTCFYVLFIEYDYYKNEESISTETEKKLNSMIPNYVCDKLYLHSKHYDTNRRGISVTFDEEL